MNKCLLILLLKSSLFCLEPNDKHMISSGNDIKDSKVSDIKVPKIVRIDNQLSVMLVESKGFYSAYLIHTEGSFIEILHLFDLEGAQNYFSNLDKKNYF